MMEPMNSISTGCRIQTGPNRKYWKNFGAFEVPARVVDTVKDATAERWRAEAPAGARFVPVIALPAFDAGGVERWQRAMALAAILDADTALLHTPAGFRPTGENRARLRRFVEQQRPDGLTIAWWADGLWESQPEDRDALCEKAGLLPAIDPLGLDEDEEPPPGPQIYWRLMGRKGLAPRYTDYEITTLLDLIGEREAGYVVFTAPTMLADARRFSGMARAFADAVDPDGDDGDEGPDDHDD